MAAITTTAMRVQAANQFLGGFSDSTQQLYFFIGGVLPWLDDNSPPTPVDCELDQSAAFLNMMSLKRINVGNVSLITVNNTWTLNTVYTQYVNNIDLFDPSSNLPPFFVISSTLNVYKCINNNLGSPSTVQPTGTATTVVTLSDGYQWKYMYTVNSADVLNFVTSSWIPVDTLTANDGSNQWLVQASAVPGTIDRIDMLTAGTQFTAVPTVVITGNGTGAAGTAIVSGGNVIGIQVTATGSNYTWATISFTGGGVGANGATANAVISPFGGHGSDPVSELGGFYVLVNSQLIYDENGTFTVSNDYRQVGILRNPLLNDGVTMALDLDYDQSLRLTFGTVSGTIFNADEVVTGNISGATGVVLDWTASTSVLRLVQVIGSFVPGETVIGEDATGVLSTFTGTAVSGTTTTIVLPNTASSVNNFYTDQVINFTTGTGSGQITTITNYVGSTRTATLSPTLTTAPNATTVFVIASIVQPDLEPFSGQILYLENRRPIARTITQVENLKVIVVF